MGWKDDPIVGDQTAVATAAPAPAWKDDPVAKEAPTVLGKVGRQVGLTARSAVSGAASIPAIGADALGAILNLGIDAYNKMQTPSMSDLVTGKKPTLIPRFEPQAQVLEKGLSAAGLPEPSTPTERIVYRTNQALAGQGATVKGAELLSKAANPNVAAVGNVLTTQPGAQLTAAGGAGAAGGIANESGASPLMEFIASLTGGIFAPSAVSLAKGVPGLVEPFTTAGQRSIAGNVLSNSSTSPVAAITAIRNGGSAVPGVNSTLGAVTRDPGLASLERSVSAKPVGASLQDQYLQNNAARVKEIENMAGSDGERAFHADARASAADELYQKAYDKGTDLRRDAASGQFLTKSQIAGRKGEITKLIQTPAIQKAMEEAKSLARNEMVNLDDPASSVKGLDYVKRAMDDQISKATGNEQRILVGLKNRLLTTIDSISPDYAQARLTFAEMSKPINQMDVVGEVMKRSIGTGEDRLGNRQLLPSGMQRSMDNIDQIAQTATGYKAATAEKILTPEQMTRLESLRKDLADAAFSQSGGRVAGSNTVQLANYSTANIIGRIAGGETGPITRNIGRGLDWLNKLNDRDIDRLLVEAVKDPALAGTLMKDASPDRIRLASDGLEQLARSIGIGTAQATASGERTRKKQGSKSQ